jgi:hypothetical protein
LWQFADMTNQGQVCEVKMKSKFIMISTVFVVAFGAASFAEAAPAKYKVAHKRAPISQSVTNYSCEGTDARISSNALNGNSRSEYKFSFGMQVNRGNGTATIMGARGSNLIHSGRYIMSAIGNGFSLFMNWVDDSNNSQSLQVDFANDGSFSGSSSESGNNSSPVYSMLCELIGSEFCGLTNVYVTRKIEGVCWQQ